MKKIKENICPQNANCCNVKSCDVSILEQVGYDLPVSMIENGKCIYCEKCQSSYLKSCQI